MNLLEISLAISLSFGAPGAGWEVEAFPRVHLGIPQVVEFPITAHEACGVAFPYLALTSENPRCEWHGHSHGDTLRHEDGHLDQYEALGPALLLLHVASNGTAVEDYLGPEGSTWFPTEDQLGTCPLIRASSDGRVELAPCYNPFTLLAGGDK